MIEILPGTDARTSASGVYFSKKCSSSILGESAPDFTELAAGDPTGVDLPDIKALVSCGDPVEPARLKCQT